MGWVLRLCVGAVRVGLAVLRAGGGLGKFRLGVNLRAMAAHSTDILYFYGEGV